MPLSFATAEDLKPAIGGTLLYVGQFVSFMMFQSFSKLYLVKQKIALAKQEGTKEKVTLIKTKYYNSEDHLALCGDRTFGNLQEQAIAYLPLYWLHSVFVAPEQAMVLAGVWVGSRMFYPLFFYKKSPLLFLSTGAGYGVCLYMAVGLFNKAVE